MLFPQVMETLLHFSFDDGLGRAKFKEKHLRFSFDGGRGGAKFREKHLRFSFDGGRWGAKFRKKHMRLSFDGGRGGGQSLAKSICAFRLIVVLKLEISTLITATAELLLR